MPTLSGTSSALTLIRIGSRGSRLALTQAELAAERLRGDGVEIALVPITTAGDKDRTKPFGEIGSRGVFVKEIEEALLEGRIDVAVHSAKDMTSSDTEGLVVGAYLPRDDPRDALCGADELRPEMRVGTASVRRRAQLLVLEPGLAVEPLRGNVETRLRKRRERGLDAIVLAACGLDRLGLGGEIGLRFAPGDVLPEAGPGAGARQVGPGGGGGGAPGRDGPMKVIVTRPRARAGRLVERVEALGQEVVECPLIEILPTGDEPIDTTGYDWVVLTSPNGAEHFARRRRGGLPRVAAVGPGTAETLRAHGIDPELVPRTSTQEGLLAEFPRPPGRVLVAAARGARRALIDGLGADFVPLYDTALVRPRQVPKGDVVLLASGSAARSFAALEADVPAATIGPQTTSVATSLGLRVVAEAPTHDLDGLVQAG